MGAGSDVVADGFFTGEVEDAVLATVMTQVEARLDEHLGWDQPAQAYALLDLVSTQALLLDSDVLLPVDAIAAALVPLGTLEPRPADRLWDLEVPAGSAALLVAAEAWTAPASWQGRPSQCPDRREVRHVVAVTRDGKSAAVMRTRGVEEVEALASADGWSMRGRQVALMGRALCGTATDPLLWMTGSADHPVHTAPEWLAALLLERVRDSYRQLAAAAPGPAAAARIASRVPALLDRIAREARDLLDLPVDPGDFTALTWEHIRQRPALVDEDIADRLDQLDARFVQVWCSVGEPAPAQLLASTALDWPGREMRRALRSWWVQVTGAQPWSL